MTEDQLKALLARNPQVTIEDNDRARLQDPQRKPVPVETLENKAPVRPRSQVRITVRVISKRARLIDETNLRTGFKFLEDALVNRGLIPGDAPGDYVLSLEQTKVRKNSHRD